MDDDYAILQAIDPDQGEMVLFDTGNKEKMTSLFDSMVVNGETGDFYLIRFIKSAEIIVDVKDHGDEDESNS